MELERSAVVEKIKEGKAYGLNYAQLARDIGMQPITIYMFINGTYNLSKIKQLQAMCVVEEHIGKIKEKLRVIEHRGLCVK